MVNFVNSKEIKVTKEIKIISGANYGDEGKGLVTNYFSDGNTLVVFSSNSAQRGHTVVHQGKRHVFRHFGSGTFKGAATYFADGFIINPSLFRIEYQKLVELTGVHPIVYYNPKCLIATPYDMLANQIIENARGENRFGSCGCGAWETQVRYKNMIDRGWCPLDLQIGFADGFCEYMLDKIGDYYTLHRIPTSESMKNFNTKCTKENIQSDIEFFINHAKQIKNLLEEKDLFNYYNQIIFENSQGLLLDTDYNLDIDYTTPAHVGTKNPIKIIKRIFKPETINIENIYISRTYLTRHGNGSFGIFTECQKEEIDSCIGEDKTNVHNPFQGSLRYGRLDEREMQILLKRIKCDHLHLISEGYMPKSQLSLVLTHVNEHLDWDIFNPLRADLELGSLKVYLSENEESIKKFYKEILK